MVRVSLIDLSDQQVLFRVADPVGLIGEQLCKQLCELQDV
ncbi:hypothetical protein BDEG_27893 [Batrachochytrium dendrobatidis JEL423]|uniref:Uncharacterized protein n=1 Tax=Batrachochytrium dendrobatidis (strain JEL423) TaxID=403673 RepID=A0A177WXN6_BATDL|nr:hypothetical protein BDEG_27893 [Batrachochytrium dendrobatidis JEL423]